MYPVAPVRKTFILTIPQVRDSDRKRMLLPCTRMLIVTSAGERCTGRIVVEKDPIAIGLESK
jgi:hypothetical protein